jgi:hypothetical protein
LFQKNFTTHFTGFRVICNGEEWDDKNFRIRQKHLLIISPSKKSDNARLRLTILRNEYNDEIGTNIDRTLYEDIFEYITHDSKTKKNNVSFQ